jgi:RHS repeat-associated protein
VRGLRASGGASLGGYRYSAFGQTLEDTSLINQPLRWKGRWFSPVAGGTYDVRARQWSPELGIFLSVDEYWAHDPRSTLWGWGAQNPVRFGDPTGRGPEVGLLGPAGAAELALGLAVSAYLAYLFYEEATQGRCSTRRRSKQSACLDACEQGTFGREAFCRKLKDATERARCWEIVEGSLEQCQVFCQGL